MSKRNGGFELFLFVDGDDVGWEVRVVKTATGRAFHIFRNQDEYVARVDGDRVSCSCRARPGCVHARFIRTLLDIPAPVRSARSRCRRVAT
jgi:hypothetical protein